MSCLQYRLVDAHFSGSIAPREERALREHVTECDACRARYRRQLLLAKLDPTTTLTRETRLGRALGIGRRAPVAQLFVPFLAVAAALFLLLRPADSGFTARGVVPDMISTIRVYRIADEGGATLASESLQRSDELAFTYQNGSGKTHLMIFGVDEHERVYWFHPAWMSEQENPTAIPIDPSDPRPHELREAIRHRFEGQKLEIHGLFLNAPITVKDAEAAVHRRATGDGPVSIPEGIDHVTLIGIAP